jgi:hypothetical protein
VSSPFIDGGNPGQCQFVVEDGIALIILMETGIEIALDRDDAKKLVKLLEGYIASRENPVPPAVP